MDVQQTTSQEQKPKRTKRRYIIWAIIIAALIVATVLALSSLGIIPGYLAIIITAFALVFGVVFTLLTLIPPDNKPVTPASSPPQYVIPEIKPEIKIEVHTLGPSEKPALQSPMTLWMVPYPRNPFFTGREALLEQLHDHFSRAATAAITQSPAITGLGGIGKTQIAIEHAYRHREEYQYILWVNATEPVTLTEGFVQIARLLQLPIKEEQDQNKVVEAVKQWLTNNGGWLLILDNSDDLPFVQQFLPTAGKGHILLTTRDAATGSFASFEVDKMDTRESMELLLQRAKILTAHAPLSQASEAGQTMASTIVEEMDGLPLAIDQAGAYIEETHCGLSAYLKAYQKRRNELLRQRGRGNKDHPDAVATTWSLNFEQAEQQSPIAADLLRFFAFLAPEAIPEELIVNGAPELGEQLEAIAADETRLDEAISTLRRFSLVQRNSEKRVLFIHRLVQGILKASMTDELQRQWSERTIRAVNDTFPSVEVENWPLCERLLPHALMCNVLIDEYTLAFPEAARLLNQTGYYLYEHAQYEQAEPLMQHALTINEQALGPNHPETAYTLNNLALLYRAQGKYKQAELLMLRALAIREKILGLEHPDTVVSLNNLSWIYDNQGEYEQAEPLMQRALTISEKVHGPEHPNVASSLNNLAWLYRVQAKYKQAEPLMQRALAIREKMLGPEHPDTAICLNNLARLYRTQGQYEKAEALYLRALAIREKEQGPDHPNTAISLNNLGELYHAQHQYDKAEPLYKRACTIVEQVLGPEHPHIALSLNNLARLYRTQGQYEKAEALYLRALAIREKMLGPEHPDTAICLYNLARLYSAQDQYEKAEPLMQRALAIREMKLGLEHPYTANILESYAVMLQKMKRTAEAATLGERAKAIRTSLSSSI